MSFFSEIFSSSNQPVGSLDLELGSSVLSATGLSRTHLATLFRQDGLFGHESDLSPVEQAVVQSRLGPIAGLRTRPVLAPTDARLIALESFTDTLVRAGGRSSEADEAQLVAAGYSEAAVSEVLRVVRLARDVFGLAPARNEASYPQAA
jgi:hypothetical protein